MVALIDSGAAVNVITEEQFEKMLRSDKFKDKVFDVQKGPSIKLKAFAQSTTLEVIATFMANLWVTHDRPQLFEKFYVIRNASRALLGSDSAKRCGVLLVGLKVPIGLSNRSRQISDQYNDKLLLHVSAEKEGEKFPKFNMNPVKINIDSTIPPSRKTYNCIERAFEERTDERLRQMLSSDIIEKVVDDMRGDFCSVLLAVPKGPDDFRLVVDLRGPNKCIVRSPHRMPTLEDIMSKLHGSTLFSNLDLTNGFFHVELHEDSRHVTNFFTRTGMFRYKRLPFGLCNAPDIFQEAMEKVLEGCEGVLIYLDDILIYGKDETEHDRRFSGAMSKLKAHNVMINNKKSKIKVESCTFLGFQIDKFGYHITDERLKHIRNFRRPTNLKELQSFLGLMNFVDKFIVNRADETVTLQEMIRKKHFEWSHRAEFEFNYLKNNALERITTLGYYNPEDEIELYVDASPIGLGAILVQRNGDKTPRIITCASKVLSPTERRYPQTQREALAVVWGTERFRFYLLGRDFTIFTDAEANEFLFEEGHRIGKRSITRAESWTLRLQPFNFVVKHVPSEGNYADAFSRLVEESQSGEPSSPDDQESFDSNPGELNLFSIDPSGCGITYDELGRETEQDETLQKTIKFVKTGAWPHPKSPQFDKEVQSFHAVKRHLQVVGDFLTYKWRFVVPKTLRQQCLQTCHQGHIGGKSMKHIVKESFYWPNVNKDVENHAKSCETCMLITPNIHPIPYVSRDLPDGPMDIIQVDFLYIPGCGSQEFMIVKDTYSRYFWCIEMKTTNMKATNGALDKITGVWGHPRIINTDNGPPFKSPKFTDYWLSKGVTHRKTVPYCPEMNGMVENKNQGILRAIRGARTEGRSWRQALCEYIDIYNNVTPHSTTMVTPFELMTGRKFRGFFPDLFAQHPETPVSHEEIAERDARAKDKSIIYANLRRQARESDIKEGDWVYVPNSSRKNKLDPFFANDQYQVLARVGAKLSLMNRQGDQLTRSASHVKKATNSERGESLAEFPPNEVFINPSEADRTVLNTDSNIADEEVVFDSSKVERSNETWEKSQGDNEEIISKSWKISGGNEGLEQGSTEAEEKPPLVLRRSGRVRKLPKRFQINNLQLDEQHETPTNSTTLMNFY